MKNLTATAIMMRVMLIAVPVILAVGAFMGYPHDEMLSGFFWLIVALNMGLRFSGADKRIPDEEGGQE